MPIGASVLRENETNRPGWICDLTKLNFLSTIISVKRCILDVAWE